MSFDQTLTVDAFDDFIASRIRQERSVLAGTWLGRLRELLQSDPSEVFPGHDLLDHIPALLDEIAEYVRTPADEEIAANSAVVSKARELGILRHQQQASLHQVLREYEILAEVLEAFVVQEADRFTYALDALSGLRVSSRIARSVRALMHTTVETFIEQYTGTIDEQRKRLESYARMVTHEMRTLVGTIVVATGLLDREEVGQDEAHRARVVTTIKRNAERQANLIQQLQRIGLEHAPVDLPNEQRVEISVIAREVVRQLAPMAESRDVELTIREGLPAVVNDPGRLELVMINLVSNAIKYSDPSKPTRWVEVTPEAAPSGSWAFAVRDNGLGLSADAQHTMFDRAVRLHADQDSRLGNEGLGLGLTIVKECVSALGGTILCEYALGEGTTFRVIVPLKGEPSTPLDAAG